MIRMRIFISGCVAAAYVLSARGVVLASELPASMEPPLSLSSISTTNDQLTIPIVANMIAPPEWVVSTVALSAEPRDWKTGTHGYIFYTHNWQPDTNQLNRKRIGEEITLHFQSGRPKKFVIQNLFAVGPKSSDRSELALQPDTMLIYSSTGFADRDRLVILAKELPTSEVSSL